MELYLRKAKVSDAQALAGLLSELVDEPSNLCALEKQLAAIQDDPRYCLLVAEYHGKLAGTVMGVLCRAFCGGCRPFMVVENMVVSPKFRRMQVGKQLFMRLEEWAGENGCAYAILVSSSHLSGAHQFYEQLGYARHAGFRKYFDSLEP